MFTKKITRFLDSALFIIGFIQDTESISDIRNRCWLVHHGDDNTILYPASSSSNFCLPGKVVGTGI